MTSASLHCQRARDDFREPTLVDAFISLQLFGMIGNFLILLTACLSRSVVRHSLWFNFVAAWVVSAFSYLFLFFSGQLRGDQPTFGVCVTQAMLIYGAPPLCASTTFALVIYVWFGVRPSTHPDSRRTEEMWTITLLILPYALHVFMAALCLTLGLNNREVVHRGVTGMYCKVYNLVPGRVSALLVTIFLVLTLGFIGKILFTLRRNGSDFRHQLAISPTTARVMGFGFFGLIAVALGLAFALTAGHTAVMDLIISLFPGVVFIIFGSQSDILRAWMFWKKSGDISQEVVSSASGHVRFDVPRAKSCRKGLDIARTLV